MAPFPAEQPCESTAGAAALDSQRSIPTPFLTKIYQLVDDPSVDDMISWNDDGSSFIVWRPAEFARDLLPKYLKHNNFSSFIRQLNTYGFRKVVPDRCEFANDCFRRGEKRLLRDIQRRKMTPTTPAATVTVAAIPYKVSPSNSGDEQAISSNSAPVMTVLQRTTSCTTTPEILEENERLRKENMQLNHELNQLKGLCNNILALMKTYASGQLENNKSNLAEGNGLDLFPVKNSGRTEVVRPKLFGVTIGLKRVRNEDSVEEQDNNQVQEQEIEYETEVKAEPLDAKTDDQILRVWSLGNDQILISKSAEHNS